MNNVNAQLYIQYPNPNRQVMYYKTIDLPISPTSVIFAPEKEASVEEIQLNLIDGSCTIKLLYVNDDMTDPDEFVALDKLVEKLGWTCGSDHG